MLSNFPSNDSAKKAPLAFWEHARNFAYKILAGFQSVITFRLLWARVHVHPYRASQAASPVPAQLSKHAAPLRPAHPGQSVSPSPHSAHCLTTCPGWCLARGEYAPKVMLKIIGKQGRGRGEGQRQRQRGKEREIEGLEFPILRHFSF